MKEVLQFFDFFYRIFIKEDLIMLHNRQGTRHPRRVFDF